MVTSANFSHGKIDWNYAINLHTKQDIGDNTLMIESPESSSPLVTRAVAAGLKGYAFIPYQIAPWQRTALHALARFPAKTSRFVISRFESFSGLDPKKLHGLSIDTLAEERIADYRNLNSQFPAITVGAALGGASAFLSLALHGPFLPQAFVVTLKGGSISGESDTYFQRAASLAKELAEQNPTVMTIQHYDPIHDEWMTRRVNHLRFKLLDLPESYKRFIRKRLQSGGTVCFLDCQARWLRFRVGKRSVFQVGGWGDISAEEYLEGSKRIHEYARRTGLKTTSWRLDGFPIEHGPESEWGTEPGLGEAIKTFCEQEGYRFICIQLPEPHEFSRLAFNSMQALLEQEGSQASGVLIEMFSQFDPISCLHSGLLPLWLVFNTWDSLSFLKSMLPLFPPGRPVFFSPLSTFTLTPDLVPWNDWESTLNKLDYRNVGVRPTHYPSDPLTLIDWGQPLRNWVREQSSPVTGRLTAEKLFQIANTLPQ